MLADRCRLGLQLACGSRRRKLLAVWPGVDAVPPPLKQATLTVLQRDSDQDSAEAPFNTNCQAYCLAGFISGLLAAQAAGPGKINYQGRLTDELGNPVHGEKAITVRIFGAAKDGKLLYEQSAEEVKVVEGV
jgi:hypothetical protein